MSATDRLPLPLLRSSFLELDGMYELWGAAPAPGPELVVFNEPLAVELGLDPDEVRSPRGVAALLGHGLGADVVTSAQAFQVEMQGVFRQCNLLRRRDRSYPPVTMATPLVSFAARYAVVDTRKQPLE